MTVAKGVEVGAPGAVTSQDNPWIWGEEEVTVTPEARKGANG